MLKKVFLTIICILILLTPLVSYAASELYTISELKLNVTLPNSYDVITRDMDKSAAALEKYGLEPSETLAIMQSEDRYIEAINHETGNEILVSGYTNSYSERVWSITNSDREKMDDGIEHASGYIEDSSSISVRTIGGQDYWYYTYESDVQQLVQYTTVENGMYIVIAASSFNGNKLQNADISALDSAMKRLSFTEITAPDTGFKLALPENAALILMIIVIFGVFIFLIFRITKRLRPQQRAEKQKYDKILERFKNNKNRTSS